MKVMVLGAVSALAALSFAGPEAYKDCPDWENPYVTQRNRLPSRSELVPFPTAEAALTYVRECQARTASPYVMSLDGTWKFSWAKRPEERVKGFWRETFDVSGWKDITVPGCWQLQGDYDPPIYVNSQFPHVNKPPYIMADPPKDYTAYVHRNPVGSYRRDFTVPADWAGRRVVLHFDGAGSAYDVWVNGKPVGYSEDSKLPAEFDVTSALKPGKNSLSVEVYRWSDGSYLECQDFWRLSGIHRSVWLLAERPEGLRDYVAVTTLDGKDGTLTVTPEVAGSAQVTMHLYDGTEEVGALREGRLTVRGVKHWNAEEPNLYTLLFAVTANGKTEYAARAVGFREVKIEGGVLKVNGRRIEVKGVNRHEMTPDGGYVVSRDEMVREIERMKRMNINAVRTCHYPNATEWYDLCDRHGLYVLDEANIEAHGRESIAGNPDYLAMHVERCVNMALRDRNHPSVIGWSMGNESGFGENFKAAYRALKQLDPTRFVQYQRASADFSDVACPMYTHPSYSERYGKGKHNRPLILQEYAHAMGNSTGDLIAYWHPVKKYPTVQGGFIWDWRDQAVWKKTPDGKGRFLAYGGDFGEKPNTYNFNCNGLVDATGEWHPGAYDVRKVYQSVEFSAPNAEKGTVRLKNTHTFRTLAGLSGTWELIDAKGIAACGTLRAKDFAPLAPGQAGDVRLEGWKPALAKGDGERFLTVRLQGDVMGRVAVVADEQFALGQATGKPALPAAPAPVRWAVKEAGDACTVSGNGLVACFDRKQGVLAALEAAGRPLIIGAVRPEFWRAPTDNDRANGFLNRLAVWRKAGAEATCEDFKVAAAPDGTVTVATRLTLPKGKDNAPSAMALTYRFGADGNVALDIEATLAQGLPELPRVGIAFRVPKTLDAVAWFGRGPHENMADRIESAYVGHYATTVAKLNDSRYVRNQELGHRMDTRRLTLEGNGLRLAIHGVTPFGFNVLPWTAEDLTNAGSTEPQHPYELPVRDFLTVTLDAAHMGVGGINTWGARPEARYRPQSGQTYRLNLVLTNR